MFTSPLKQRFLSFHNGPLLRRVDQAHDQPLIEEAYNFWFPNPDDSCYATPVDAAGIYKISGYRGTVHLVDFEIAGGQLLPTGTGTLGALEAPAGAPLEKLQNLS